MTTEPVVCEGRVHRYGNVRVEAGDPPVACACGGVTVSLLDGQLMFSMTVEAMNNSGIVNVRSLNGKPGYSLAWSPHVC